MKKNLIRLSAAAMAAVCVLSLGACGSNNNSKAESGAGSSAVSTAASTVESSQAASSAAATDSGDAAYTSVQDFINSAQMQADIEELKASAAEEDMDIDVTAEGNTMVLTFDLGDYDGLDEETASAAAELLAATMDDTMAAMADELAENVTADDAAVKIRFIMNGGELYSETYPANAE